MHDKKVTRIAVFDIIKLFAIFLVIWGHCLLHLQNYQYDIWDNPLYRWISSFHMPLFMMISGFFSAKIRTGLKEYIQNKFYHLIFPSLTFGILFVVSWHFICGGGIFKPYILCYWFLKSAFICSLLYYFAEKVRPKLLGYLLTVTLSIGFYLYMVNLMYIPFLTGVWLFRHKENIKKHSLSLSLCALILYLYLFTNWNFQMASMPLFRAYMYLNSDTIHEIWYPLYCYIYKIIMGLSGSIFIITLFIELAKWIPTNRIGKLLGSWGMLTLGIYLWQAIILEHIMMKTIDLSQLDYTIFNYIVSPLLSLIILVVCVGLTKLLKANTWTNYIFLGNKPSNNK